MIQIGQYTPAQDGRDAVVQREFYGQGYIVKDEVAFLHHPDQVCYVPELSDEAYTHEDFLRICDNQESLAQLCFYAVNWQAPETWYDEQFHFGEFVKCEACGRVYDTGDHDSCPHCVKEQKEDGLMDQAKRPIPTPIQRATLCPRCGQPVIPSDNPEYRYQCLICDEDFYSFECTTVDDQAVSFPSREFVALLREYYHAGERVELISMNDPYHPPKPGDHGTVQCIDDAGNIHVSWDCGSGLSAIPGVDEIRKLEGAADNE